MRNSSSRFGRSRVDRRGRKNEKFPRFAIHHTHYVYGVEQKSAQQLLVTEMEFQFSINIILEAGVRQLSDVNHMKAHLRKLCTTINLFKWLSLHSGADYPSEFCADKVASLLSILLFKFAISKCKHHRKTTPLRRMTTRGEILESRNV